MIRIVKSIAGLLVVVVVVAGLVAWSIVRRPK
jgi:hypothetical protein